MQKRKHEEEDQPEFQLPNSSGPIKRRISDEMASASEPMDLSSLGANTSLMTSQSQERPGWPSPMQQPLGLNVAAMNSHPLLLDSLKNNPGGVRLTQRMGFEPMTMTFPASASASTALVAAGQPQPGSSWHQPQKFKGEVKDSDDEEVEEINAHAKITENKDSDDDVRTPDINQRITGISVDEVCIIYDMST